MKDEQQIKKYDGGDYNVVCIYLMDNGDTHLASSELTSLLGFYKRDIVHDLARKGGHESFTDCFCVVSGKDVSKREQKMYEDVSNFAKYHGWLTGFKNGEESYSLTKKEKKLAIKSLRSVNEIVNEMRDRQKESKRTNDMLSQLYEQYMRIKKLEKGKEKEKQKDVLH